ncbi:MAG: PAS domain S-box protein, partial [Acidobacteria bacterium]|nr:PAS domain S-box protein [Acidobacteriota bacterium]
GLDLVKANLYLAQGTSFVAVRPEEDLPPTLARPSVPERLWQGEFETLAAEALPGESLTVEQRFFLAGYRYAFPLEVRGVRIGLVLTSLRRDGRPLDSEDVEIVRALLDPAALALENAQLLDQVQRQLERVVALQQHNEGILESSPAGIAVLDQEGQVVSANLAFAALAGRPRAELLGQRLSELVAIPGLPEPGAGISLVECRDGLGRERQLQVSLAPLQGGERFGQRVLVLQDVSDRVAMENALKEKDRLASLGVLAAGVAHEVNTPLTGISSYAQLLLAETDEADPRHDLLRKVERQTFRASRIVSGLLEFARKPGRERRPVALGELLSETAELLRERLSKRSIRLRWTAPEAGEDLVVQGSEGELQQVFTNLLLNAIDAMAPQGGGDLELALELAGDRALVRVDDSGPGLRPEHLDRIFEPFFTTKRDEGGTGLGLSISYNIVEQHGGKISAENRQQGGCRFVVELPLAADGAAAE